MKPPERIARAVRKRVEQADAEEQRNRVMAAVEAGSPLDAEPESARKIDRIQAVTGVTRAAAAQIVEGRDPAELGLAGEARLGAERIQGTTVDFVGVSFLDLARAAASAVGRVIFRRGAEPEGSGFLISDRLFLTNNHVIPSAGEAHQYLVEFDYELDVDGNAKPVTRFALDPASCFFTSAEDNLDFTVVALGDRVAGTADVAQFGSCRLMATTDKHVLGEFVNVIQHPDGDYKQVVLRENRLVTRLDTVLHYMADTMPGSSGSPVFNDQWEAVALHHYGEPFRQVTLPNGRRIQQDLNEGIRISAIVNLLANQVLRMEVGARQLIEQALRAPAHRYPTGPITTGAPTESAPAVRPSPEPPTQPDLSTTARIAADGSVKWIVPVELSVRVGHSATLQDTPTPETPAAAEAIRIDRNYKNRDGYKPEFLPGHEVPLPKLTDAQRAQAVRRLQSPVGEDPCELKYQHFSLILNGPRRMAYFTAVNIDGEDWTDIDRDTGEPREAAEAKEKWFQDTRIPANVQQTQALYDDQRPRRVFDRGHLVRRQDPAWGTTAQAKRANADTFHFTNCTPQESDFNQRAQFWQGIENYVLNNAVADKVRISVLTGPVLADADPPYRDVQVPMKFWKILVRVADGELLATALLADQTERISRFPERREGFDDLGRVAEYQTSVAEIERLTGLDFGNLRDHDTFADAPEAIRRRPRPLQRFEQIHLGTGKAQPTY